MSGRGRGRPKREYRIRVRAERRDQPDYDKLARALLEHAAIQQHTQRTSSEAVITNADSPSASEAAGAGEEDER